MCLSEAYLTLRTDGGPRRIRTSDTRFRKPLLYPLSYGARPGKASAAPGRSPIATRGDVPLRQPSMSRTSGTTRVAYNSIERINWECGMGPLAYFRSKRWTPNCLIVAAIFAATVSGEPT